MAVVRTFASDSEQFAQELVPDGVRCGRGKGLAHGVQFAKSRRILAQRLQQAGLADAGLADDLDHSPRSGRALASASRSTAARRRGPSAAAVQ